MARRKARWRVAGAVANAGRNVVSGVGHTSSRSVVGVLIDGALQLLQELVNVQEIALGPEVGKRQRVGVVHGWVLCLSNH